MTPFVIEIDDEYSLIEINDNIYDIIDEKVNEQTYPNNYYLLVSGKTKILTKKMHNGLYQRIFYKTNNKIAPKDSRQSAFMHSLENENISLSVCLGQAGTGKTTLAVAYALQQWDQHNKKIFFSKAAVMVGKGRAFGPVPGDVNQKYAPYLESFKIVLKKVLGAKTTSYIDAMIEVGNFNYQAIEFVRGNTYENCTFILDECQNLTWHELKTLLSRMGEKSKIILIGDPFQKDVSFRHQTNGLDVLINSDLFKVSEFTSFIQLEKQYRSPLADLIYKIDLDEIKKYDS